MPFFGNCLAVDGGENVHGPFLLVFVEFLGKQKGDEFVGASGVRVTKLAAVCTTQADHCVGYDHNFVNALAEVASLFSGDCIADPPFSSLAQPVHPYKVDHSNNLDSKPVLGVLQSQLVR